jgi:hypothetical protein
MRTMEGLEAARSRGRAGGRKPKLSPLQVKELLRMVEAKEKTMAEIGELFGISRGCLRLPQACPGRLMLADQECACWTWQIWSADKTAKYSRKPQAVATHLMSA